MTAIHDGDSPTEGVPGILGRALLADGALLYLHQSGTWRNVGWHSREDVEREHETVREVLLVSPAAWERLVRLADAAARWRYQFAPGPDTSRRPRKAALIAAVDAAAVDHPEWPADMVGEPDRQTADQHEQHLAAGIAGVPSNAEPVPVPDSVPGWDRETIDSICENDLGEPHPRTAQIRALLADRDALLRRFTESVDDWVGAVDERDTAREERDAARAERDALACVVAEIRDDLGEGSGGEPAALPADVRTARERLATGQAPGAVVAAWSAELNAARTELAEVTAQRDKWRDEARVCHDLQGGVAHVLGVRTDWDAEGRRAVLDAACRLTGNLADARRERAEVTADRDRLSRLLVHIGDAMSPTGERPEDALSTLEDDVRALVDRADQHEAEADRLRGELEQARQDHPAVDLDWWSRDAGANALEWAAGRAERLFGTTTDHPPLLTSPDLRAMAAELRSGERHIGERHIEPRPAAPTATTEPTEGNQP